MTQKMTRYFLPMPNSIAVRANGPLPIPWDRPQ